MKKLVLLLFLFAGSLCKAQETTDQFSVNFLIPSAEYEFSIGEKSSIDLLAGVGFAYRKVFDESDYGIFFQTMAQYRYYYNFRKRMEKGKNVSNNSGNYIAAVGIFTPGESIIGDLDMVSYSGLVGPAWGLQRVYGGNFKLNLNLGVGYGFNEYETYVAPFAGIQLGFKLGGK